MNTTSKNSTEIGYTRTPSQSPIFRDIIFGSQEKWRKKRQNPFINPILSQGLDISEPIARNSVETVIANFPPFITDTLKEKLREVHPTPVISLGMLADNRFFSNGSVFKEVIPEKIVNSGEQGNYEAGICILNEMATDTLAEDVIHEFGTRNKWFAPVAAYLKIDNPVRQAYASGIKKVKEIFKEKGPFEDFRQDLILSMLTGEREPVDQRLNDLGYDDLDTFAAKLGESSEYTNLGTSLLKLLGKSNFIQGSLSGGFCHSSFPGVIYMPQISSLIYSLNIAYFFKYTSELLSKDITPYSLLFHASIMAATGYFGLKAGLTLPHLFAHEEIHYLSKDLTHWGLRRVEFQKE